MKRSLVLFLNPKKFLILSAVWTLTAILPFSRVWGWDWKYYSANEHFFCFYDPERVIRPNPQVVQVWLKWLATQEGKKQRIKEMAQGKTAKSVYEKYESTRVLMEVDCRERTYLVLAVTDFDEREREIPAGAKACYLPEFNQAFPIARNTSEEDLYAIFCAPGK